jgi:hypothetical protein
MTHIQAIFMRWLPFAVLTTFMSALIFIAVQQDLRLSANDPQIELAHNGAVLLAEGQSPEIFGASANVDIANSLLPFIIVYDLNGKVLNGTGMLNGTIPVPPMGVLQSSQGGQNRLTWEPTPGVRIATIVVPFKGKQNGYILVGKSLSEVEDRINKIMLYVFIAWLGCLVSTFVIAALQPKGVSE